MHSLGREQGRAGSGSAARSVSGSRSPVLLNPDWLRHLQRVASGGRAASAGDVAEEAADHAQVQRAAVDDALRSTPSPLEPSLQSEMEARYDGADFSAVQVHKGTIARKAAAAVNAKAFTTGQHIVDGGAMSKKDWAHELAHTLDPEAPLGTDNGAGLKISDPRDSREQYADSKADSAMSVSVPVQRTASGQQAAGGEQHQHGPGCDHRDRSATAAATASIQRVGGGSPSAPAQAPAPAAQTIDLNSELGTEIPDYWNSLNWHEERPGMLVADLPQDHEVFRRIQEYAQLSQARAPYTSQAGEHTRMNAVENDLNNPDKRAALGDAGVRKLQERLREKEKDGPNPPKSRLMQIERITVLANPTLWRNYLEEKEKLQRLMLKKGGDGFTTNDPSEKIKWSTGSRPDLGGAAGTRRGPEPEVHPMSGGSAHRIMPAEGAAEAFLFHGTSPNVMDLIQQTGYDPTFSENRGTEAKPRFGPLGRGIYAADSSSKAQTYARCAEPTCADYDCRDPNHPPKEMLLNRGMVGYATTHHMYDKSKRGDDLDKIKATRTSVYSPGLKVSKRSMGATAANEFLFKNKSHLYPEIRIYYRN